MKPHPRIWLLLPATGWLLIWLLSFQGTGKPGHLIDFKGNPYEVYLVNLRYDSVAMFYTGGDTAPLATFDRLQRHLLSRKKELLFATNGGMFTPEFKPVGLYIQNGKTISTLNKENGDGNFFLKPNGVFSINHRNTGVVQTTESYLKVKTTPKFATQSGPMLVIDGKIHPAFNKDSRNTYIRSGVGQVGPNLFVFAISTRPVTFYDFAEMFLERYECRNALYLDGAISKMYIKGHSEAALRAAGHFGVLIGHYK